MKKSILYLGVVIFLFTFASFSSGQETEPAGKKIFMDQKCNVCHSIESQSIVKKTATSKGPDLSNIGAEKSAEWIQKFLNKEETLNNKKHSKSWAGKKEDLTTLSAWLATLKKAP